MKSVISRLMISVTGWQVRNKGCGGLYMAGNVVGASGGMEGSISYIVVSTRETNITMIL